MRNCLFSDLGLVEYKQALLVQERLHALRKEGALSDALLFVEHPPVITMGRHAVPGNILASNVVLSGEGISIVHTGRGGDVTFHGPGQLVAYPIVNLGENGLSVARYVWNLEEVMIRTLAAIGIRGERIPDWRGVFVNGDKIGAIGVRINSGVSMHGLALNVNTELKYFDYIIPCGLKGIKATSVAKIKVQPVDMAVIKTIALAKFTEIFDFEFQLFEAGDVKILGGYV